MIIIGNVQYVIKYRITIIKNVNLVILRNNNSAAKCKQIVYYMFMIK